MNISYEGIEPEVPVEETEPVEISEEEQIAAEMSKAESKLNAFVTNANIAEELRQEVLDEIGMTVVEGYDIDKASRAEWEEDTKRWMELAKLITKRKSWPWDGAANIKYPLIAQSAIQFAARAYPALVVDRFPIKGVVIGADPDGKKAARALRIGEHSSYDLLEHMRGWEENTDRLLTYIAVVGTAYRKTYRDTSLNVNVSEFCTPEDVIVNNWAPDIDRTPRITHRYELYPNEIESRKRSGVFLVVDLGQSSPSEASRRAYDNNDKDAPHEFLEQHRWLDLDDDGYQEPYVVTVHLATKKVVRITARFDSDGIITNSNGEIIEIVPVQYFTKFTFIPSLDGSFYGVGFGSLLGPGNEVINTTINQLLDAATNSNTGGGIIDSAVTLGGANIRGTINFSPGEYRIVGFSGDDLRKHIWDRTVHEPSLATYQLLTLMIESQEKLSSVADILMGGSPVANVPATTSMATIEQALKLFTAIYKRIHRSLKEEFSKLRRLHRLFLRDEEYFMVLDQRVSVARDDYNDKDCDVIPASNPNDVTDTMRLLSAQALLELRGTGLNDREIRKRYLEALRVPEVDKLLPSEDAEEAPDPALEIEMRKLALEERKVAIEEKKVNADIIRAKADAILAIAKAEAAEKGTQIDGYRAQIDALDRAEKDEIAAQAAENTANTQQPEKEIVNDGGT